MTDPRIDRLAQVLVSYSTSIREGDRVLIEAQPAAEPLIRALYKQILDAGGHPHMLISLSSYCKVCRMPVALARVSCHSAVGFESATMPPPTWN